MSFECSPRLRHAETAFRLVRHYKLRLVLRSINTVLSVARRVFNTTEAKMINWKALDNVPLLLYILALKTLLLCLAFAGVKIYQSNKIEKALKKEQAEKRRLAQQTQELIDSKKED